MNDKTCPVCESEKERGAVECSRCGWDFSPMLGTLDQMETLLRERLDRARKEWRLRRYNPELIPALDRDPFDTIEEFAARQAELTERPWYVGEGELQKADYDIDSGRFPLRLISRQGWAKPWLQRDEALSLTLPRDQARALYQQGAIWPLYARLATLNGRPTLVSLILVVPEAELPVESGITQHTSDAVIINGRFRDLGDGTVLDTQTGLQWMRCALGQKWYGRHCVGKGKKFKWDKLVEQVHIFNNRTGGFGGFSDWRLPSQEELATLILMNSSPTIDQQVFPNSPDWWFWSSSPTDISNFAWSVDFGEGKAVWFNKSNATYVRLVRGEL